MISVLIVTRNRPNDIQRCLRSIAKNTYQDFEVLLIDQSTSQETHHKLRQAKFEKLRYIKTREKGKSKGLNLAVQKAKGTILAFTDDDCLVKNDWLQQIALFFSQNIVDGVFGNTHPYQPAKHPNQDCPSIFSAKKVSFYSDPKQVRYHYELGMGNNMALKTSSLKKIGPFCEWLGPGSVADAGDDSELIFRFLSKNNVLATNPKMIVWHNRWLDKKNYQAQELIYSKSLFSFFSYYLFTKHWRLMIVFILSKFLEGKNARLLPSLFEGVSIGLRNRVKDALRIRPN